MNTVIKSLQNWKEAPVDSVVLSFHHLQNYYLSEIKRGFCGIGNYSVKLDYVNAVCDPDDVIFPQNVQNPDNIIDYIKSVDNSVNEQEGI